MAEMKTNERKTIWNVEIFGTNRKYMACLVIKSKIIKFEFTACRAQTEYDLISIAATLLFGKSDFILDVFQNE